MKTALIALAIARALDAGTSCAAFHRGGVEGNPMIPTGCRTAWVVQGGVGLSQSWGLHNLGKHHPKVVQMLAWVTVGVEGMVAWHNNGVGR